MKMNVKFETAKNKGFAEIKNYLQRFHNAISKA
jgi:hypothetical protein